MKPKGIVPVIRWKKYLGEITQLFSRGPHKLFVMEMFHCYSMPDFICPDEWPDENYGFRILEPNPHPRTTLQVNTEGLRIGDRYVKDYMFWTAKYPHLYGKVPKLFCIRQNDRPEGEQPFWGFCCGFDLLDNGKFWVNHETMDTLLDVWDYLNNKFGPSWEIFMEEPMRY